MKNDNRPIGVFDSGLGGLTVAAALRKAAPNEDIIYLGDTARVPYGDKSPETIRRFGSEICGFLSGKGVKAAVIACNTVASVAAPQLRKKFRDLPLVSVLEAGVAACLEEPVPERLAVLGTKATVSSDAYRRGIHRVRRDVLVESVACPLFVPLAEEGLTEGPVAGMIAEHYLRPLRENPPDIVLLGCTHYPLLQKNIAECLGPKPRIIDSATACADFTVRFLEKNSLRASARKKGSEKFFVTDMPADFFRTAARFFGSMVGGVEKISLKERV
jgi:glutamate racemase